MHTANRYIRNANNSQFNGQNRSVQGVNPQKQLQKIENKFSAPQLVFKRVSTKYTEEILTEICSKYGHVTEVRANPAKTCYFMDLATEADMQSVFRALECNSYGFQVVVCDRNYEKKKQQNTATSASPSNDKDKWPINREFVSPNGVKTNNFLCPNIKDKHIVEQNCNPRHNFSNANNANTRGQSTNVGGDVISFASSRFYDMEESCPNGQNDACETTKCFGNCHECGRRCEFTCQRCGTYFCDKDCQKKSWIKHRYVCGIPKSLQRSPPLSDSSAITKSTANPTTFQQFTEDTPPNSICNQSVAQIKSSSPIRSVTHIKSPSTMQSLVSPSESQIINSTSCVEEDKMPLDGQIVTICSISKINIVFIRSKNESDYMSYCDLNAKLNAAAKTCKPLEKQPKCGQIVGSVYRERFSRAMILDADNLLCIKVVHIEYGVLAMRPLESLYSMPEFLAAVPRSAIPVILKNVQNCPMTADVTKIMNSYIGVDLVIKYDTSDFIAEKGVYRVELIEKATSKSLNKILSILREPMPSISSTDLLKYLEQKIIDPAENIDLLVMDNLILEAGWISCTTMEYAIKIQKLQSELQLHAKSMEATSHYPCADELYLVKSNVNGEWHRGRCLSVGSAKQATFIFIDYGSTNVVDLQNVRTCPPKFTQPIYTSDCKIEGLPEVCTKGMAVILKGLLPIGSLMRCSRVVLHKEERINVITVPSIIRELHKMIDL